jgi:hypothetical protein
MAAMDDDAAGASPMTARSSRSSTSSSPYAGTSAPVSTTGHDVDDVVQETVERVLAAREPLEPDTALAYGLVVARNVLATRARDARRARRHAPRVIDLQEPVRPNDAVVAAEQPRRCARRWPRSSRPTGTSCSPTSWPTSRSPS